MDELTIEEALDMYSNHFGFNYPLMITSEQSDADIIEDILKCIVEETPKEEPSFDDGNEY